MNLQQVKQGMVGEWVSLAPEIRPSANKNPDGSLKPFYLRREFKYFEGDVFELTVVNSADPYGAVPHGAYLHPRPHALAWRSSHRRRCTEGRLRSGRGL